MKTEAEIRKMLEVGEKGMTKLSLGERLYERVLQKIRELDEDNKKILYKRQHPSPFAVWDDDELKQKVAFNSCKIDVLQELLNECSVTPENSALLKKLEAVK